MASDGPRWDYDEEADAVYVQFSENAVDQTLANEGSSVMIDLDRRGNLRGIEVLLPLEFADLHEDFRPHVPAAIHCWMMAFLRDKPWLSTTEGSFFR